MTHIKRYGLIGSGMMGIEHIQNIAVVDGPQLAAISDPHKPSATSALAMCESLGMTGVTPYADHREMMARENLDAVIIASPNFTHFEILQDSMSTDVAILCEKPLCTTVDHAQQIAAQAAQRAALFWTGLEYRYMPPVAAFIDRVHSGQAGDIRMLSIREHRFPFLPKVGDWNRFSENTGGTLTEKCCHFFDLMRVIMREEPVRIYASGAMDVNHRDERYDGRMPDILDNAFVIVDFESGARAHLDLCMFADGSAEQEEIYALGDRGKLEVKIPSANITWSPRTGFMNPKQVQTEHIATPDAAMNAGAHHGATFYQLTDFHAALISGAAPTVSAHDGLRSVQMGAAAHRSIEIGQPIDLDFSS